MFDEYGDFVFTEDEIGLTEDDTSLPQEDTVDSDESEQISD